MLLLSSVGPCGVQGDCGMATASGVNALLVPTAATSAMTQVHALSPDGRCKAFGLEADGYGRGEGYTAVVLEPAAGGRALALIGGSSVNQDGRSSGLTAPHGPSQHALIMTAMREAGAAVLEYVATHGTGAALLASGRALFAGSAVLVQKVTSACCPYCGVPPSAPALQARLLGTPSRQELCARRWHSQAARQASPFGL